jgi:hypothetical protein
VSDLPELLQIVWEDFKASDDSYMWRVVLFGVLVISVIGIVGLAIYAA